MALYVAVIDSLLWPQEVPVRERNVLLLLLILVAVISAWFLKVSCGSKVTPRIFGFLLRGSNSLFIKICGCLLSSEVSGVNSVTVDFEGEIIR